MDVRVYGRIAAATVAVLAIASCGGQTRQGQYSYEMDASLVYGPVCHHVDQPYSDRICQIAPADSQIRTDSLFRPMDVAAETLVVHTTSGKVHRIAISNRADAIFLSKSALETFLLRHYDATNPAKAADLRAYIAANFH